MDAIAALIIPIVGLVALALAALEWGVDSRPTVDDEPRPSIGIGRFSAQHRA